MAQWTEASRVPSPYLEPVELDGELLDGTEDHAHVPEGQAGGRAAQAPLIFIAFPQRGPRRRLPGREAIGLGGPHACPRGVSA